MKAYSEQINIENAKSIFSNIYDHASIKIIFGALAYGIDFIFGVNKEAVVVVAILLLLDTATGAAKALKAKNLSSQGFFRFATKCMVYFTLIATGRLVDRVSPYPFASSIMEAFLGITEGISIMENLHCLGFKVPSVLVKRMKDESGDDDE